MGADGDVRAYDALSQHARIADLAALAHALMTSAAEARRSGRPSRRVVDLAAERRLTPDDAATPFGNALQVLDRGPSNADERALARALAAHALAAHRPKDAAEEALALRRPEPARQGAGRRRSAPVGRHLRGDPRGPRGGPRLPAPFSPRSRQRAGGSSIPTCPARAAARRDGAGAARAR